MFPIITELKEHQFSNKMGFVVSTAVGKLYLSLEKCTYDQELRIAEKTQLLQILGTHGKKCM